MATQALSAASSPLLTGSLLYILTRGPPSLRERLLAPFGTNLLAHNSAARIAAVVAVLKVLTSVGLLKGLNQALNRLALNNWRVRRGGKEWRFGAGKEEVVVVTGASSGFGFEMVRRFARVARVVAVDVVPVPEELAQLSDVTFYQCDVTDFDAVQDMCKQIRSRHGDPTVLINNAGIGQGVPVLQSTNEYTEKLFKVNIISHFALIREFLPGMLAQQKGHIVTMASLASFIAGASMLDYCCSKVAALYLSDGIRSECLAHYPGGDAICTTSVHPTFHATAILTDADVARLRKRGYPVGPASDVSDVVVEQVLKGKSGGRLFVPKKAALFEWNRSLPLWAQDVMKGHWRGIKKGQTEKTE